MMNITQQNLTMHELLRSMQGQRGYPIPWYVPMAMPPYKETIMMVKMGFRAKELDINNIQGKMTPRREKWGWTLR